MQHSLIVVAHGTASRAGRATTDLLVDAVRSARPDVDARLCFLDVASPRLEPTLALLDGQRAVVVPLLLSTGFHVQADIPAAVTRYPQVQVARHLGPHPLLATVLAERLAALSPGAAPAASTVLVGAGSTRAGADLELAKSGRQLARLLGYPVTTATIGDGLRAALDSTRRPTQVATYLLAEGRFAQLLRAAATDVGDISVALPLGVHPALVELVWRRYDEVVSTARVV